MVRRVDTNGATGIVSRDRLPNGGMLTVSEAAAMLNAHPNSVRRWADIGLINSYRIGLRGDRRFQREDVAGFLNSHEKFQRNGALAHLGNVS